MPNPQKKLPKLESLDNPKAALELYIAFQRLYEYIDFSLKQLEQIISKQVQTGQLSSEDFNSLIGVFSQPLAGSSNNDPLLQSVIQSFGSQSPNLVFASPDGTAGNPTFRVFDINDLQFRVPLAKLDLKITKTDDGLTKTLGAPVADGFITLKDNNGNSVKLVSTA